MTDPLWCPRCRTRFTAPAHDLWRCGECGIELRVVDDVVRVTPQGPYWGEVPEPEADRLVEACRREGVKSGTRRWVAAHPEERWLEDYILDLGRADWRHLLELKECGNVLDLGAGWGTISEAFARDGHRVHAVEPVDARVRMIGLRARELDGTLVAIRSDLWILPFPEAYFDLILLVGVLEWIPTAAGSRENPTRVQLRALRHCRRFLKPGGTLLLAIENRFNVRYFFGATDHGDPSFAPLMPRWLADAVCLVLRGKRYRTRTYSARGYRCLLRRAGFQPREILLTLDYHISGMISQWDQSSALKEYFRRLFQAGRRTHHAVTLDRWLPVHRLWAYLSPSFLIQATRVEDV